MSKSFLCFSKAAVDNNIFIMYKMERKRKREKKIQTGF